MANMRIPVSRCSSPFRLFAIMSLLGFIFILPSNLIGQLSSAAVNGTVTDTTGAVIPGAQVSLENVSTGAKRTTTTNSAGAYTFVDVTPGNYTLAVSKSGFAKTVHAPFVLYVNQTARFNFSLKVGSQVQQVTVTANTVQLATSTENLGTVVNHAAVNSLPLNGRNFTQLLTLTPGSSPSDTSQGRGGGNAILTGSFGFPAVNGQMNRSNLYLLDGIIDEQFWFSEYAVQPIVDDIGEFKVQSHNDQSQFGGVLGGIVNVVTRSGTRQFHGDAWEFLRNDAFDATNPILAKKTPLKQSVYGATLGGPVILPFYNRNQHTFFFGAYEGTHISSASSHLYNVPTAAERTGDFSDISQTLWNPYTTAPDPNNPGKYIRQQFPNNDVSSAIDPVMQKLINQMYPAPVTLSNSSFNGEDTSPSLTNVHNYTVRIDRQFNSANSVWGRISQSYATADGSGGMKGLLSSRQSNAINWGIGYLHTFGSSATLQVTVGHVNQIFENTRNFDHTIDASGFNPAYACGYEGSQSCMIPSIGVTGYGGGGPQYLKDDDGDIYQYSADFTKLMGHHTWSAGAMLSHNNERIVNAIGNLNFSPFQTENLESAKGTGNAMASFLIGVPTSGERRNNLKIPQNGWVNGVYAGDQWKVTPKLTLNIGLRYDWVIMPTMAPNPTKSNISGSWNFRTGNYVLAKSAAGLGSCETLGAAPCIPGGTLPDHVVVGSSDRLINNQYDNIEPRLGFSYQIDSSRVLHVGYDRTFDNWSAIMQMTQNQGALWPSIGLNQSGNLNTTTVTASAENPLNFPSGQSNLLPAPTPFNQSAYYIAPYLKNPYSDQWTVGIQQMFGNGTILTMNYVGSHSSRLPCCDKYNVALTPGPGDPQSRAPFPYAISVHYEQSNGSSNYNALQVELQRRMASGLSYHLNYTWSKTMDVACDGYFGVEGCFVRDPYNPGLDRSVAGIDLPQMFTANASYQLPFGNGRQFQTGNRLVNGIIGGWQVNAIASLTSGNPFTVTFSGDAANTGNNHEAADQVGNPKLSHPTIAEWFNTSAYTAPAQYTFGNAPRNGLRTDWHRHLDASVFRRFDIEKAALEFRAEAFNATNTPVWGGPGATVNSPTFGKVSGTASTQRELQFALKLYF